MEHTKGVGVVLWSWMDDEGQLHTNNLKNVLDLTRFLVNILNEIVLIKVMKGSKGT